MAEQASPPAPEKGKSRKGIKIILLSLLGILLIAGIAGGLYAWRVTAAFNAIVVNDVDVSTLPDDVYRGSYKSFHVSAEVMVTVEDHSITSIELLKASSNQDTINEVMGRVVEQQSLQVDLVSGASTNQKVALKAVEEALSDNQ